MSPARIVFTSAFLGSTLALCLGACLPPDNRPVPGSVLVMAEPSDATKNGFTTEDGWEVKFDRVLMALGHVDLDDQDEDWGLCTAYSETHYEWLYDFVQVEREKVGLVYGLGDCGVEYRVRGPDEESVVGTGATQADVESMESSATDAYVTAEGVTVRVVGTLAKDDKVTRFDWSFRRSFEVSKCATKEGEPLSQLTLESEAEHTLRIEVRAEELFRRGAEDAAPLSGEIYELADDDGDGILSWDELEKVAVGGKYVSEWKVEGLAEDDLPEVPPDSLADIVYELLLPRITRVVGGAVCEAEVRGRR